MLNQELLDRCQARWFRFFYLFKANIRERLVKRDPHEFSDAERAEGLRSSCTAILDTGIYFQEEHYSQTFSGSDFRINTVSGREDFRVVHEDCEKMIVSLESEDALETIFQYSSFTDHHDSSDTVSVTLEIDGEIFIDSRAKLVNYEGLERTLSNLAERYAFCRVN